MNRDIRQTDLYREAESLYRTIRQPSSGQISDAAEVNVSPDGRYAIFSGAIVDTLEGVPSSRICQVDLSSGDTRVLTFGPNTDRSPKFSPDGRFAAFLSDRAKAGDFQLHLLDLILGASRPTPAVNGWVEYLHWSPDGRRILLGVAGHGADISGGQGAVASKQSAETLPSWVPAVEIGGEDYRRRCVWIYDVEGNAVSEIRVSGLNVWEAAWCGNETVAAIASTGAGEGLWYSAKLVLIDTRTSESRELYTPQYQLGWPSAPPSGKYVAVVEAVCSDRWIVAGRPWLIETGSGKRRQIDARDIDVTYTEWRSDDRLLLAGHRGFETAVGMYDTSSSKFTQVWASRELSAGWPYVAVSGLDEKGGFALVGESFTRAPELAKVQDGHYHSVRSFDLGYGAEAAAIGGIDAVTWTASDGLEIQGWLIRPHGHEPHPLVMNVHGGPVWQWHPIWLGRGGGGVAVLMLLKHGYAVFFPNPRGSTGRGQEFARHVLGDMGGAETTDHLSGIDHLAAQGVADPKRLGVMGQSHGGFMTSWIITQDERFAAAVPIAPVTNWVSEHLLSNIPHFCSISLGDKYTNTGGKYFQRSPIMHAHKVKTPTLNICGALDRCTPAAEALQFHNALLLSGTKSVLVTYPEEGHGVRTWPAMIDYAARVVGWFEEHMASQPHRERS